VHSLIIVTAKYLLFLCVAVVGVYWLFAPRATKVILGWQLIIGGIIAVLLSTLAGHLYYDTRPFVSEHIVPLIAHAPDNGFPSDHALLSSFLGFTMMSYSRRIGVLLLAVAVLIGAARVAAHIHQPIDIVGSFVIAAVSVLIVNAFTKWRRTRSSHLPDF
jgi:undecaprenyl-diphosphatase